MLPYDVARCGGHNDKICLNCRRTEDGDPRRQVMLSPPPKLTNGDCHLHIPKQEVTIKVTREVIREVNNGKNSKM